MTPETYVTLLCRKCKDGVESVQEIRFSLKLHTTLLILVAARDIIILENEKNKCAPPTTPHLRPFCSYGPIW
jgi:hypothetical protein